MNNDVIFIRSMSTNILDIQSHLHQRSKFEHQLVEKMEPTDSAEVITYSDLEKSLLSYISHVPPDIQRLDSLRLNDTPETLAQRKKNGEAFLEKEEVTNLVQWKLWVTFIEHVYRKPPALTYILQ